MHRHSVLKLDLVGLSAVRTTVLGSCLPVVLLVLLAFPLPQNSASAQESDDVDVLRVSTDLVVFPVRVTDKKRNRVVNLTEADLILKDEDQVATAPYLAFGAERVAMIFALDESGSLRGIISEQRDTAIALFDKFEQTSRIAVLRFAERPKLIVSFGQSAADARAAFNFYAGPNRRTAIFDAAQAAVETFTGLPDDPAERRIVVLLSDGLDTASSIKATTVINAAREKGISFYVIHVPLFEPRDGRLAVRSPSKGFRELAEKSGGRYFIVGDSKAPLASDRNKDLSPIFLAIAEDLKSQYLLGFYVGEAARDGRKHRVSITLKPPGLSYSVRESGFSRTHHFSVNMLPKGDLKPRQ